jgi:hypothetical protein
VRLTTALLAAWVAVHSGFEMDEAQAVDTGLSLVFPARHHSFEGSDSVGNHSSDPPSRPERTGRMSKVRTAPCLEAPLQALETGFYPVVIYPPGVARKGRDPTTGKEPFGPQWGLKRKTADKLRADVKFFTDKGLIPGVGLCLGPGRAPGGGWLADIEGDGPEAESSRATLYGGEILSTAGWRSTRGSHQLLTCDGHRLAAIVARLAPYQVADAGAQPGVFHCPTLPGLELRLGGLKPDGTVKQLQSVCPPTAGTDGQAREWNGVESITEAPEAFYTVLAAIVDANTVEKAAKDRPRSPAPRGAAPPPADRYVSAAVECERLAVEQAGEGNRNSTLNKASFALGQFVGAGALDRHEAEVVLLDAALRTGLSEAEARSTIRSGLDSGASQPRDLSNVGQRSGAGSHSVNGSGAVQAVEPEDDEEVPDLWPKLDPKALHGIAGEFVEIMDPHTEADRVATLTQFLVAFGNLIGRNAYYAVGSTRHYLNMFTTLVGQSASGRKGTSWDLVEWLMSLVDSDWADNCIKSGLISGEGLIYNVRDERREIREDKHGKKLNALADPGISDKRLLVIETELARTIKAMNREGNTLSDVMRHAWDSGRLRSLAKNSPLKATGAHISIIGHTTREDIRKHLSDTDSANGFANRFLWLAVRRSKMLPDGGNLATVNTDSLIAKMRGFVTRAREAGAMSRDETTAMMWRGVYPELSAPRPGLLGGVTNRAVPQTLRLSCLFALLDGSKIVRPEHLEAALAIWEYAEASARMVFGDSLGDPSLDKLLAALRAAPQGLTQTEINHEVFQRNKKAPQLLALLSDLLTQGAIHGRPEATGGRKATRWFYGKGYDLPTT